MRLLHTMIRVGDLDRSIAFYTDILGMKVLRRRDYPDGKFTLAFVGYGDEADHTVIELTHNWETSAYELGNGFGHLAVAVPDAYKACEMVKAKAKIPASERVGLLVYPGRRSLLDLILKKGQEDILEARIARVVGQMPFRAWLRGGFLRLMPVWFEVK